MTDRAPGNETTDESAPDINTPGFEPGTKWLKSSVLPLDQAHRADIDVFVLANHRHHKLCRNTYFVTGVGNKKRVIPLGLLVDALSAAKA